MSIEIDAVYENGVLKLENQLPLKDQQKVRVTIHTPSDWVERTAGMLQWTGSREDLRQLAEDVEFDWQEGS